MKKIKTLIPLLVIVLGACEEHDNNPEPAKQLRPQSMSYGDFHYRILHYNAENQISSLTTGMLVDGDSSKNVHQFTYEGDRIVRMDVGNFTLEYFYENGLISETREYDDNALIASHVYEYDQNDRVTTWAVLQPDGDNLVPFTKTEYTYGEDDNLATQKLYIYEAPDYRLLNTIFFEDYDDKKSSSALFMGDIYNLYDQKFKNNARVWRLVNANGSTAEQHYEFEYNLLGYVTRSTPSGGGGSTIYRYTEY
jgi:hypothetical protein